MTRLFCDTSIGNGYNERVGAIVVYLNTGEAIAPNFYHFILWISEKKHKIR